MRIKRYTRIWARIVVAVNRKQPIWAEYQSCRCNTCRDWSKSKVWSVQVKCQQVVENIRGFIACVVNNYSLRLFNFCLLFFHQCCATIYDGEIKLYIKSRIDVMCSGAAAQTILCRSLYLGSRHKTRPAWCCAALPAARLLAFAWRDRQTDGHGTVTEALAAGSWSEILRRTGRDKAVRSTGDNSDEWRCTVGVARYERASHRSSVPTTRRNILNCAQWLPNKGSPYSITECRVPELIPVLGSQPAGGVSHKPGGRLPLLSAMPAVTLAVTLATIKRAATSFAAWWTEARWVWTVYLRQRRGCDLNPGLLRLSPAR